MYGWPVRGHITILKEIWTKEIDDPELRSTYEYVVNLRERLESTCELVKQNLEHASRKQAKMYNRRSRLRKVKVGQKVLVLLPTKASKLLMHWKGPYEVVDKVSELDYKIKIKGKVKMFHINMLKLYIEREGVVSNIKANCENSTGRCAIISIVDEEVMKCEDGQALKVPPAGEVHETYEQVHINSELSKEQSREITNVLSKHTSVN